MFPKSLPLFLLSNKPQNDSWEKTFVFFLLSMMSEFVFWLETMRPNISLNMTFSCCQHEKHSIGKMLPEKEKRFACALTITTTCLVEKISK